VAQLVDFPERPIVSARTAARIIASASALAWCVLLGLFFALI
jgi:hypothetical protein